MTGKRSPYRWLLFMSLAGALLAGGPLLAGPRPVPSGHAAALAPAEEPPPDRLEGRLGMRTTSAPVSRLPVPAGAEIWVDVESTGPVLLSPGLPGAGGPLVLRSSVLVLRPHGDALAWDTWTAVFQRAGLLPAGAPPLLRGALAAPAAGAAPATAITGEYRVFSTRVPTELLVLRLQINPRTGHQLAAAVRLSGRVDAAQAGAQAQTLVDELTAKALAARESVPVPTGAQPANREVRFSGPQLRSMLEGILQDPLVSPRVKEMARTVLPQATSLRFSVWRTHDALPDSAFFDFYTQQAARLGWGAPLSRDATQPTRPALLFQRPNNDGVVMVRAQPAAGAARPGMLRAPSYIFVLVIEGRIDASSLAAR